MRFLFLTNFYPPADLGGWEQWCQEIAVEFRKRGHEVMVLTSRFRKDQVSDVEPSILRDLYLESDIYKYNPVDFFLNLSRRDESNKRRLQEIISSWQPDIVMIWGMWQLNPELAALAEELCPGRVLYYLCGYWLIPELEPSPHTMYWTRHSFPFGRFALGRLSRRRTRRPKVDYAACVSKFILETHLEHGFHFRDGRLIYGGIDTEDFSPGDRFQRHSSAAPGSSVNLLFAGALSREKGADTVINAVALLSKSYSPKQIQLSMVGGGHPLVVSSLHQLVEAEKLESYITFRGRIPKQEMSNLLLQHDVLLFASTWEEPLARMMMEGLASATVVISTPTGGSKEAIQHGHDGLLYETGNAADLAAKIATVLEDPVLARKLAQNGRQTAVDRFDFQRMADEIESFSLQRAAEVRHTN